jgi:hypothetical protein
MRRLFILLVLLAPVIAISSCTTAKTVTPIPPPPPGQGLSTLAEQIVKHPERYEGKQVTLVGYFRGADLLDEVVMQPPKDRMNDWLIKDESGAIWVAYASKLPFPVISHEVWRIVRVTGTVQVRPDGLPYIAPDTVEWEGLVQESSVLPALCRVAIHRYGGPNDLDHHIYWYSTDNLVIHDRAADWRAAAPLRSGQVYDLDRAFNRVKFFALPETVGQPCQDCIRYELAAVDEKKQEPHFVTLYEGSVPEKLQAFIDLVLDLSAEAEPIQ